MGFLGVGEMHLHEGSEQSRQAAAVFQQPRYATEDSAPSGSGCPGRAEVRPLRLGLQACGYAETSATWDSALTWKPQDRDPRAVPDPVLDFVETSD